MSDELKAAAKRMTDRGIIETVKRKLPRWQTWFPSDESEVEVPRADLVALIVLADAMVARLAADAKQEQERLIWAPQLRAEWMERIGQAECDMPIGSIEDEAKMLLSALLDQELRIAYQAAEDAEPCEEQVIQLGLLGVEDRYNTRLEIETDEAWIYQDYGIEDSIRKDLVLIPRPKNKGELRRLLAALGVKGGT